MTQTYASNSAFFNLFNAANLGDYSFTTSAAALTGALVFDLSSVAALLPVAGATGRIAIGDNIALNLGDEFGSWQAASADVPLPAGLALLLSGAGALGMLRLKRRAA